MDSNELLKAKLQAELCEISQKSTFDVKDLEIAHVLTDTIKNIDKITMFKNGEYPSYNMTVTQTQQSDIVNYKSDSDFSNLVSGKDSEKVWQIVDELMESLSVLLPKLYSAVCEKFRNI